MLVFQLAVLNDASLVSRNSRCNGDAADVVQKKKTFTDPTVGTFANARAFYTFSCQSYNVPTLGTFGKSWQTSCRRENVPDGAHLER